MKDYPIPRESVKTIWRIKLPNGEYVKANFTDEDYAREVAEELLYENVSVVLEEIQQISGGASNAGSCEEYLISSQTITA